MDRSRKVVAKLVKRWSPRKSERQKNVVESLIMAPSRRSKSALNNAGGSAERESKEGLS